MEEAAERKRLAAGGPEPTSHEKELMRELRVLELSRTRVVQQIAEAKHEGYRQIMTNALADLDQKIAGIQQQLSSQPG
jgi:hypothetical protein